jgi:hypothetical protein
MTRPATTPAAPTPGPATSPTTQRLTDGLLVCIVLLVGVMAGAASFTHVHDWTMHNSPTQTGDWFGWANAVITELIPTAALIVITRRRRIGTPIGYPMFLLVAAVGLSLTAQLAVAEPTMFGWMVSALPALAFFALSKLVFTATPSRPTNPVTAPTPATSPASSSSDIQRAQVSPAAVPTTRATTTAKKTPAKKTPARRTPAKKTTAPAAGKPTPAVPAPVPAAVPAARPSTFPDMLLTNARTIADAHRAEHGEPITSGQLAVRLKVPTMIATDILTLLEHGPTTNMQPHNGSTVGATA